MQVNLVNMAWQLGGDRELVRNATRDADVVIYIEARTRDSRPISINWGLGSDAENWRVQQNLKSSALAGTALAVNRKFLVKANVEYHKREQFMASPKSRGVQARYAQSMILSKGRFNNVVVGGHAPLKSTGVKDDFYRNMARELGHVRNQNRVLRERARRAGTTPLPVVRWLWGGDSNLPHVAAMHNLRGSRSYGHEVMSFVLSAGWGDCELDYFDARGSDHPVLCLNT